VHADCTGIGDEGGEALTEVLKINTSLTSMDLSHCYNILTRCFKALGESLKFNRGLTIINLSGCRIGDEGYKALGEGLKTNTALKSINLSSCGVGHEGCIALSEGLKSNEALTSIELSGCEIDDEGCKALAEGLESNKALTTMDLSRVKVKVNGLEALAKMAKVNTTLLSLKLDWYRRSPRAPKYRKILEERLRENAVLRSVIIPMVLSNAVFLQGAPSFLFALGHVCPFQYLLGGDFILLARIISFWGRFYFECCIFLLLCLFLIVRFACCIVFHW